MKIAVLAILSIGAAWWSEGSRDRTHEKLRAMVVDGYYASAGRGEVAAPAAPPGSVRAVGRCGFSLPYIVRVTTVAGEERTYFAQGHPRFNLAAKTWTFTDASEPIER